VTTILLARHGETSWNRDGRFQGHADPGLSEEGRRQASALADELAGIRLDAVYSSDLRRAVETATIVAGRLGLTVETDRDLREVDVGEWSGLTWVEIEERFPDGVRRHHEYGHGWEHGESYEQMAERVLAALHRIADRHDGGRVLVITHGGGMRAVAAHIDAMGVVEHRRRAAVAANCEVRSISVHGGVMRNSGSSGAAATVE
jgi:2,3-bisphosphoglycerate-dependent phosphoglycerate mutase